MANNQQNYGDLLQQLIGFSGGLGRTAYGAFPALGAGAVQGVANAPVGTNPLSAGANQGLKALNGLIQGPSDPSLAQGYSKRMEKIGANLADAHVTGTPAQHDLDAAQKMKDHAEAMQPSDQGDSGSSSQQTQQQAPQQFDPAILQQIQQATNVQKPNFFDWLAKAGGVETPAVKNASAMAGIGPNIKQDYMAGQLPLTNDQQMQGAINSYQKQAAAHQAQIEQLNQQEQLINNQIQHASDFRNFIQKPLGLTGKRVADMYDSLNNPDTGIYAKKKQAWQNFQSFLENNPIDAVMKAKSGKAPVNSGITVKRIS